MNDDLWNAHLERLHTERYGPLSAVERERYGIPRSSKRALRTVRTARPKRIAPQATDAPRWIATAPLRGVCHTCGARDVERTVPENGYLPVCGDCA